MKSVIEQLFELQDLSYKDFHKKLIPNIDEDNIIGVRTPVLRKFAKEFAKSELKDEFLNSLPHKYYDENNLHAFVIEAIKDYDECINKIDEFLPYIDNWATCDSLSPKIFKKHKKEVYDKIKIWIKSDKTYTVRFAIVTLLANYLDDDFEEEMLTLVTDIKSEEYYINMAIAWYVSMALVKQYDSTIKLIQSKKLDKFTHNKSIQKAIESYRVDDDKKKYLRTLKIK
ncbi:MAG: DNA alkylation repair protein [Peptoanaerobacter stomatis]